MRVRITGRRAHPDGTGLAVPSELAEAVTHR